MHQNSADVEDMHVLFSFIGKAVVGARGLEHRCCVVFILGRGRFVVRRRGATLRITAARFKIRLGIDTAWR